MTRRPLLLASLLVLPVLPVLPAAQAAPTPPSTATVILKDSPFSFAAKTVTLQLAKDGTAKVTWKWDTTSMRPHNVKDDKGSFNSHPGCGEPGIYGLPTGLALCGYTQATTFTQTFRRAGTFTYHCSIHGGPRTGMAGTVIVKAAPRAVKR